MLWKWLKQRTLILCLSWLEITGAIWGSSFSRVERKEPDKGRRRKWGVDSPPTVTFLLPINQTKVLERLVSLSLPLHRTFHSERTAVWLALHLSIETVCMKGTGDLFTGCPCVLVCTGQFCMVLGYLLIEPSFTLKTVQVWMISSESP